jgi:hypothetical protein
MPVIEIILHFHVMAFVLGSLRQLVGILVGPDGGFAIVNREFALRFAGVANDRKLDARPFTGSWFWHRLYLLPYKTP